ncbi:hypothetical protein F4678DRAFT_444592 [Xylaria arbuscula]|nr:hypothetical protein F4678DRAFT_444592 [Xylaria arbuscula]
MDQDREQEDPLLSPPPNPPRRRVGRPAKPGGATPAYVSRGLRAPKTKITVPETSRTTRLEAGELEPRNYRVALGKQKAPRGSGKSQGPPRPVGRPSSKPRRSVGRPLGPNGPVKWVPSGRPVGRPRKVVREQEDDDPFGTSDSSSDDHHSQHQDDEGDTFAPGPPRNNYQYDDIVIPDSGGNSPDDRYLPDSVGDNQEDFFISDHEEESPSLANDSPRNRFTRAKAYPGTESSASVGLVPLYPNHGIQGLERLNDFLATVTEPEPRPLLRFTNQVMNEGPASNNQVTNEEIPGPSPAPENAAVMIGKLKVDDLFPSPHSYINDTTRGKYWSERAEKRFQELWVRKDHDSRFTQATGPHLEDEMLLWKIMVVQFQKLPYHLFTYGLKLGKDCYEAPGSLILSSEASRMLQMICSHPVWGGNIADLRFVLQLAVQMSIPMHPKPFGSPPVTNHLKKMLERHIQLDTRDRKYEFLGIFQYSLWTDNKPDRKPAIHDLVDLLHEHVLVNDHGQESEHSLFILTLAVMEDVISALEKLDRFTYFLNAKQRVEHFQTYYGTHMHKILPRNIEQLVDIKWLLELCELRDIEIRKVMRNVGKDFLLDISQTSTLRRGGVNLCHHHPDMDREALRILRGEITDPKRALMIELDRDDGDRAKALDGFTNMLIDEATDRNMPSNKGKAVDKTSQGTANAMPMRVRQSAQVGHSMPVHYPVHAEEPLRADKPAESRKG